MNKNAWSIIGIIVLVIVVGGVYASMGSKDDVTVDKVQMEQKTTDDKKMAEENSMIKPDSTKTGDMMDTKTGSNDTMMKVGSYEAYSADKLAKAATGDVVLFFHASWCPSCRGLNSSIEANLKSIPENVTILKTDYDKETELKKKYGVTYQHTLVQVDKDGNMIKKWSGSPSLDNLLSQIQ